MATVGGGRGGAGDIGDDIGVDNVSDNNIGDDCISVATVGAERGDDIIRTHACTRGRSHTKIFINRSVIADISDRWLYKYIHSNDHLRFYNDFRDDSIRWRRRRGESLLTVLIRSLRG